MELTVEDNDALTELLNIGYGRAAGALAELTGYRIVLEVPNVGIHNIEAIGPELQRAINAEAVSVHQAFSGVVSGTALVVLDRTSALTLVDLLNERTERPEDFDLNANETITEVGNIVLNATLGVFANLLKIRMNFHVPLLRIDSSPNIVATIANGSTEMPWHGLMIHTRFTVKTNSVTGYMVIILGTSSLDRLLNEVRTWGRQVLE